MESEHKTESVCFVNESVNIIRWFTEMIWLKTTIGLQAWQRYLSHVKES